MPDEPGEGASVDEPEPESASGQSALGEQASVEPGLVDEPEALEPEVNGPDSAEDRSSAADAVREAERRRRLAEVFGEVLPESTRDDRVEGARPAGADDRWYTENRPPHHGG